MKKTGGEHVNPYKEQIPELPRKRPRKLRGKKPPNAFLLFCRDRRQDLCSKCPGLKAPEVTALLSHLWRTLDEELKEHYKRSARSILERSTDVADLQPLILPTYTDMGQKAEKVYLPPLDPSRVMDPARAAPLEIPPLNPPALPLVRRHRPLQMDMKGKDDGGG